MRSAEEAASPVLPPPWPLPRAGDWAVFAVSEQGRAWELTLRVLRSGPKGVELSWRSVGPGTWKEQEICLEEGAWGWEGLPDLLLLMIDLRPKLPRSRFSLARSSQGPVLRMNGRGDRFTGQGARRLHMEVVWRGADDALGGTTVEYHAGVDVDPGRRLGRVLRAEVDERILVPGMVLEHRIVIERLRDGDRRSFRREQKRYRAR